MRFRLQVHEVPVEVPSKTLTAADIDDLVDRFEAEVRAHLRQGLGAARLRRRDHGAAHRGAVAGAKAEAGEGAPGRPRLRSRSSAAASISTAPALSKRRSTAPGDLGPGHTLNGPLIVERPDTTIVVGSGQRLEVEAYGNLIIHLESKKAA